METTIKIPFSCQLEILEYFSTEKIFKGGLIRLNKSVNKAMKERHINQALLMRHLGLIEDYRYEEINALRVLSNGEEQIPESELTFEKNYSN